MAGASHGVLLFLALAFAVAEASNGAKLLHRFRTHVPPPPPVEERMLRKIENKDFDQKLDHYNPVETRTWKQAYFSNDVHYMEGGPAFIFIGGEGRASPSWLAQGNMMELAKYFKGKAFMLEHRYYGNSRPTADTSTKNLRWLSADQALADLAQFILYLRQTGEIAEDTKVVVYGGSYAGNLAAWARLKYPHLVQAAIASSAPVRAQADFPEYYSVIANSLKKNAGDWCVDSIRMATERIEQLLTTVDGQKKIEGYFKPCEQLNITNRMDVDTFFETMANAFAGAVQYNRPVGDSDSIGQVCEPFKGVKDAESAVKALAKLVLSQASETCIDYTYDSQVKYFLGESWGGTAASSGYRQWIYQTCTEYGYYQTATASEQPFGHNRFPLSYFTQMCKDIYGQEYDDNEVATAITRTNLQFGDRKPDVNRVVFVNGNIDPWHALGVLKDLSDMAPAIVIDGTSHCYDMYAPQRTDTAGLTAAREKIRKELRHFLFAEPAANPPPID